MTHHDDGGPPLPTGPINYRSPSAADRRAGGSSVGNAFAGFGLWVGGLVSIYAFVRPISGLVYQMLAVTGFVPLLGLSYSGTLLGVAGGMLAAPVSVAVWMRVRWRRRGVVLGLIIGLLLTCLVPIGIFAVVCGPGGRGRL